MKYFKRILAAALPVLILLSWSSTAPTRYAPGVSSPGSEMNASLTDLLWPTPISPPKFKRIKDWKKNGAYTFCVDTRLVSSDDRVEISITDPSGKRSELLRMALGSGRQQIMHTHLKGRITPDISVRFIRKDGATDEVDVLDTTDSACDARQSVSDKLKSTSTQGSTILITIDEK